VRAVSLGSLRSAHSFRLLFLATLASSFETLLAAIALTIDLPRANSLLQGAENLMWAWGRWWAASGHDDQR
jgi:hypothetical protein